MPQSADRAKSQLPRPTPSSEAVQGLCATHPPGTRRSTETAQRRTPLNPSARSPRSTPRCVTGAPRCHPADAGIPEVHRSPVSGRRKIRGFAPRLNLDATSREHELCPSLPPGCGCGRQPLPSCRLDQCTARSRGTGLWWSRPVCSRVGSALARMSRYGPV